jgi:hypothetical protein
MQSDRSIGRDRQRSFPRSPCVQEAIEAVGVTLRYLPQYFPDPLKAFLRRAAERTIDGLNRNICSFARTLAHSQCIECFIHAMNQLDWEALSRHDSKKHFSGSLLLARIEFERVDTIVINMHCFSK